MDSNTVTPPFTSFKMPHICAAQCIKAFQLDLFDKEANHQSAEQAKQERQERQAWRYKLTTPFNSGYYGTVTSSNL